jgi:hypothetical protein
VVQQDFQEEGQDGKKINEGGGILGLIDPSADGAFVTRLLNTGINSHAVLKRKNTDRHSIQNHKLNVQEVRNTVNRLQNHSQNGQQDPNGNENLKDILHHPAIRAGEDQGMNLLSEGSLFIELLEFLNRWNNDSKKLQNSKQSQKPQNPQIDGYEGLQIKGSNGQKVNDGKRTSDVSKSGILLVIEFLILRGQVKAKQVFDRENNDRENIKELKPMFVGLINRWQMLKNECEQVHHNQDTDPLVDRFLEIAFDIRI